MKKITYITGIHGNETAPIFALADMRIPQIIANPRAVLRGVRFEYVDMNKCFGVQGDKYEYMRASEILSRIPSKSYVVDFHTTSAVTKPFVIIVDLKMLPFARKTGIEDIVYMKYNIKDGHALINYRHGISIEAGLHDSEEAYHITQSVIKKLNSSKSSKHYNLYEVYTKIHRPGVYTNFKLYENSFYPVLAGEMAYDFPGLKARRIIANVR